VELAVGAAPDPGLAAEVEVLLPGVAVGPPAFVALERSKRLAVLRWDDEVGGSYGEYRDVIIFDHEISYSIIQALARIPEMIFEKKNKTDIT
jgi:hypothetical protein